MNNSDQGMGLSVAIYAVAMMCGLALFVLPIIWANGVRVYQNPGVAAARLPGGPVRGDHGGAYPLAALHSQQIVSPAMLAELNAGATTKKEKPHRTARSSTPSHRSYAQAQEAPVEQRPRRSFFFSFF